MQRAPARALLAVAWIAAAVGCGGNDVSREVGARCDVTAECDDRCLEPSPQYPDGFCTLDCDTSADCTEGAECVALEGGVCLFGCLGNADCEFLGRGWVCREVSLREDGQVRTRICHGDT